MAESGLPFHEAKGEAAFYGPKVDFMARSALGHEYAISTSQLDFLASQRFQLEYQNSEGGRSPVYVIHRAPLGSHERFIAFLLEHYEGRFPLWLAPVQVRIIPISDRHRCWAHEVAEKLRAVSVKTASGCLRIEVDASSDRMQKKVKVAQNLKVPVMLIIGDEEASSGRVSVRVRNGARYDNVGIEAISRVIEHSVANRILDLPDFSICAERQGVDVAGIR